MVFPGGTGIKGLPAGDQEMQVQSLGQEDSLKTEMATHSSILARIIPWTEENVGSQSLGLPESDTTTCVDIIHVGAHGGYSLVAVCGPLIAMPSAVAVTGSWAHGLLWFASRGSS